MTRKDERTSLSLHCIILRRIPVNVFIQMVKVGRFRTIHIHPEIAHKVSLIEQRSVWAEKGVFRPVVQTHVINLRKIKRFFFFVSGKSLKFCILERGGKDCVLSNS